MIVPPFFPETEKRLSVGFIPDKKPSSYSVFILLPLRFSGDVVILPSHGKSSGNVFFHLRDL